MKQALIVLSNGDELLIDESSNISGIRATKNEANYGTEEDTRHFRFCFPLSSSIIEDLDIYYHHHSGFIPFLTEVFCNYEYFTIGDPNSVAYSSSSVVKIVNVK